MIITCIFLMEYEMNISAKFVRWANGTTRFEGIGKAYVGGGTLRVNITKTVHPKPLKPIPLSSRIHTLAGTDPMPKTNIWGLLFVLHPGNYSHYVAYAHPDNYDTYYPGQVNRYWQKWGESPHEDVNHVHLNVSQVDGLESEAISHSNLLSLIYTGIAGSSMVIGWALGSKIFPVLAAKLLAMAGIVSATGVGIIVAIGLLVVGIIWSLWCWDAQQQAGSIAQWVQDVLRTDRGDGFMWWMNFRTWMYLYLYPRVSLRQNWCMWFRRLEWHWCEWQQSWGSERETGIETIQTDFTHWATGPYVTLG